MEWNFVFFFNSALLGIGLAMDAFSVSLANGLNDPCMKKSRVFWIAGVFAVFQALMPLIGWICIHTIVQYFHSFEKMIPWIALTLLLYIGISMIKDAKEEGCGCDPEVPALGFGALMLQGIATSIDALSVGFTIAEYNLPAAIVCAVIIAAVTFVICTGGLVIGKKFGTKLAGKASILGGVILIIIGIEIFVTGVF
ncbi:MAG: manganese efflux pump [Lachnospiraceae bacterium]|nr:manganese efflux pump [Lachnospiraceae bacterium]